MCFKATASVPSSELSWYDFSWDSLRKKNKENESDASSDETEEEEVEKTEIVAWYSPQIPVSQGPLEYWGLPGLILEVNVGKTTMLCSKIIMNPDEKTKIEAPDKGKLVTKNEYQEIISEKCRK